LKEAIRKASVLIEALPYIHRFHDQIVVIKFGGSAMDVGGDLDNVLLSVVFMSMVGMRPVLVHGGGPMISQAMRDRGKQPVFVHGRRVTDDDTLAIVEEVLIGKVNAALVEAIRNLDGKAVGVHNRNATYLHAEQLTFTDDEGQPYNLGHVGGVVGVDAPSIREILSQGAVPVIEPLGTSSSGQLMNVNADAAAGTVAAKLRARKIVFLTNVHGIMTRPDDPESLASTLTERQVQELIAAGVIAGGMLPKVAACIEALDAGVNKAHIIDGQLPHSLLLEIFTDQGVGTQILKNEKR